MTSSSVKYLLDTDILIEIARGKSPGIRKRFESLVPGDAAISAIVYGELLTGVRKSSNPRLMGIQLEALIDFLPVLPLEKPAAVSYGQLRTALERSGKIIGGNDLWIAAHALSLSAVLVTNNEREFRRVPGLKIENWLYGAT